MQKLSDDQVNELARIASENPDNPDKLEAAGIALFEHGRQPEAVPFLRTALRIRPSNAYTLCNLGAALNQAGFPSAALVYLDQAGRLKPDMVEAPLAAGFAHVRLKQLDAAAQRFERALELAAASGNHAGGTVPALLGLSQVRQFQDRLDTSIALADLLVAIEPDHAAGHFQLGLAHLQKGDYAVGFAEYEYRFAAGRSPVRYFEQPRWDGENLRGKTLLLWQEQGLGDTIQFSRYIRPLINDGVRVIVECFPHQHALLIAAGASGVTSDARLAEFDYQLPFGSLPLAFGTLLSSVPVPTDFAVADQEPVDHHAGLCVGICWQGSPAHPWDMYRSIPAKTFAPLSQVQGVKLYQLQAGAGAEQAGDVPALRSFVNEAGDLLEIAQKIKRLDLVVTVDSALAHLAASLGVATWLLVCRAGEWRWLSERSDSPWYPAMRIFRERDLSTWDDVIERVAAELHPFMWQRKGYIRSWPIAPPSQSHRLLPTAS